MMKRYIKILLAPVVLLAPLQLGQCQRTNPPVTGDIGAPAEIAAVRSHR